MSRRDDLRQQAEERWPNLVNLLTCNFNEDFGVLYGSLEGAVDNAAREGPTTYRQAVLREWRDWQRIEGAADDVRKPLERMGVALHFRKPNDARQFVTELHDRLVEQIRFETSKSWKP